MTPLFEYTRSSRREGWITLLSVLVTGSGLFLFPRILGIWKDAPGWEWVWNGMVVVFAGLLSLGYALPNIFMNRQFTIRGYQDRIQCESPHPAFGGSFEVSFDQIAHLEKDCRDDGPPVWTIISMIGQRYVLTPNYGNPAKRIIAGIRSARPDLKIITLTHRGHEIENKSNKTQGTHP